MKLCSDNRSILASVDTSALQSTQSWTRSTSVAITTLGTRTTSPDVGLSSSDEEQLLNISSSSSQEVDTDVSMPFVTGHTESLALSARIQPKILLHTFSNGGTNTATQLLIALHETQIERLDSTSSSLPLQSIILDSCPVKGTYMKSYNAMVFSLPKGKINKLLGAIAVHFLLTLLYGWIAAENENPASLMRRSILDSKLVTGEVKGSKENDEISELKDDEEIAAYEKGSAMYIYSKEDKMVDFTDISDHAAEARRRGWRVEEEVFEGRAHCAHLGKDSSRYAEAIERVWRGTVGRRREQNQVRTKL